MHASPSRYEDGLGLYAGGKSDTPRGHNGDGVYGSETRCSGEEGAFAVPFSPSRGVDDLMRILRRTHQENGSSQGRRKGPSSGVFEDLQYRRMHNNDRERYRPQSLKTASGSSNKRNNRGKMFERWLRKVAETSPQKAPVWSTAHEEPRLPPYTPGRQSATEPSNRTAAGEVSHNYRSHSNVYFSPSSSTASHKSKKRNEKLSSAHYLDQSLDGWNSSTAYTHGNSEATAEPESSTWNVQYFNTSEVIGNRDFIFGRNEPNSQEVRGFPSRGKTPPPEPLVLNDSIDEIRPFEADGRYVPPKSCKYGDWDKYLKAEPTTYFRARTSSPVPNQSPFSVDNDEEAGRDETNSSPVFLQAYSQRSSPTGRTMGTKDTEDVDDTPKQHTSLGAMLRMSPPTEDDHSPVQLTEVQEDEKTPHYAPEPIDAQKADESSKETTQDPGVRSEFARDDTKTNSGTDNDASVSQGARDLIDEEVGRQTDDRDILGDSGLPPNGAGPSLLEPVVEAESEESAEDSSQSEDSRDDNEDHSDDEPVELEPAKPSQRMHSQGRFARLSKVQLRPTKQGDVNSSVLQVTSTGSRGFYTAAEREEDLQIQRENNRVSRLARLYSMAAKSGSHLQQQFALTATSALQKSRRSKSKDLSS